MERRRPKEAGAIGRAFSGDGDCQSQAAAQGVRRACRRARGRPRHRRPRVPGAGRAFGLRQEHHPAHDRGPRGGDGRGDPHRRRARQRARSQGPRHRHGVPGLRALPAHDGRRQHGVLAALSRGGEGRDQGARRGGRTGARPRHPPRALSTTALGRPAPARRHGTRHRPRSQGLPVRRAAVQSRCQAPGADAHRDQAPARAPRDHDDLRHP